MYQIAPAIVISDQAGFAFVDTSPKEKNQEIPPNNNSSSEHKSWSFNDLLVLCIVVIILSTPLVKVDPSAISEYVLYLFEESFDIAFDVLPPLLDGIF